MNKNLTVEQLELKKMIKNDKCFHYMLTDRYRQDVSYFIRFKSKENAKKAIDTVEFLLNLFNENDIPEWYNFNDLERDKRNFNKLFN